MRSLSATSCPIENRLYWENCYDDEAIDYLKPESFQIAPPSINMPVAHWKYIGRKRFQPIFKRIRTVDSNIVIKLLEERLYEKAIEFIFRNYARILTSETSCTDIKDYRESKEMLFGLFNEGHTLIVYDLTHQVVLGILIARIHITGQDTKIPIPAAPKQTSLQSHLSQTALSQDQKLDVEMEKPNLRFPSSIYLRKQIGPEYMKPDEPKKKSSTPRRVPDSLARLIPHVRRISRKSHEKNNRTHNLPKSLRFNEVIYEENSQMPVDQQKENSKPHSILKNTSQELTEMTSTKPSFKKRARSVLQKDGRSSKGGKHDNRVGPKNNSSKDIIENPQTSDSGLNDDFDNIEKHDKQYKVLSHSNENLEYNDDDNKNVKNHESKMNYKYDERRKPRTKRIGSIFEFDDNDEVEQAQFIGKRYRGRPACENFIINDLQRIFENCPSDYHESYKLKRNKLLEDLRIKKYFYIHHLSVDYDFLKPEILFSGLINGIMLWAKFVRPAEELDAIMAVPRIDAYPWVFLQSGFKKLKRIDKFDFLNDEDNEVPYEDEAPFYGTSAPEACCYIGLCGQYTSQYWNYIGKY